ncbi:hypothetical protein PISMIDRAFT_94086 [Pisolithus microcarpus 441]|uniref:Uncharacterized protein n=1 Tax=Pisolithus microcarpus 441 TaxID=765257 RepID=A0A0D0A4D4_9AGAM|nr:hypothetical protein PISMIDRAFT_94086 [Pisolithus microcarpus 441]
MHLAGNISDLLISLWRSTIDCSPNDDKDSWEWAVLADENTWREHGEAIERAGLCLPSSYDHKPRNIAEKINTQYKTWEFQLYTFGLAPIFLYDVLPTTYWMNYCKLVRGFQIMCQAAITHEELLDAHALLCGWEYEFENLYYNLRESRLQFVRPCVHQVIHLVSEAIHKGPPICYAQWTMERTIGNLGEQIRQPSKPFANISREGVRRCRINSLLSVMPELNESVDCLPQGAVDLGDGYALLRKCAKYPVIPQGSVAIAIRQFLGPGHELPHIQKWARLRLPNGQIARSAWREHLHPPDRVRISRNVKFLHEGEIRCGEVQYFTRLAISNAPAQECQQRFNFVDIAVVRMYSLPDRHLLCLSSQVMAAFSLLEDIKVIRVKCIEGVIAMIPRRIQTNSGSETTMYCMMERPGYNVSNLGIVYRVYENDDDGDEGNDVE